MKFLLFVFASFQALVNGYDNYDDEVMSLPTYGDLPSQSQYAGFVNATLKGNNKIHYWFCRGKARERRRRRSFSISQLQTNKQTKTHTNTHTYIYIYTHTSYLYTYHM